MIYLLRTTYDDRTTYYVGRALFAAAAAGATTAAAAAAVSQAQHPAGSSLLASTPARVMASSCPRGQRNSSWASSGTASWCQGVQRSCAHTQQAQATVASATEEAPPHIVALKDWAITMKEGEELFCQDVNDQGEWHFKKYQDELWVRAWDSQWHQYDWMRLSAFPEFFS